MKIMNELQLLPLGVQDFKILREGNYKYADKTAIIYELMNTNRAVFLSRPRRFGKSLLLSTIRYYFLGRKELFTDLAMENLEKDWTVHPVMYFSLASGEFTEKNGLRDKIENTLSNFETEYDLPSSSAETTLPVRFANDLKNAVKKTGQKVVVLVDEYDNPLLKTVTAEQEEANRTLYKAFFATLKDSDEFLRFYMFTGVTKFSKVSIFSDLNQLTDISLNGKYNNICGISQAELEENFAPYIENLADASGFSVEKCLEELKRMYDGYHFSASGEGMYNPYSLLHCFDENDFGYYWFESGTPTFLINKLKAAHYDIRNFVENVKAKETTLKDYRQENIDPVPLFYQSGYLTIKSWNQKQRVFLLAFPNAEVKYGFLNSLAPSYLDVEDKLSPFDIDALDDAVEAGDTEAMKNWFTALFAILPYSATNDAQKTANVIEQNFQNVIFLALTMMGKYARTEVHSAKGRADCVLETEEYVYLFEFKRDEAAENALAQIDSQGYAKPYASDKRRLFKIGVNFSSTERNIVEWLVSEK